LPQDSIYYAIGRISLIEANAINSAKLERLLQANSAPELRRILVEYGWPDSGNDEQNALEHIQNACKLVLELTTDVEMVNLFLLKSDVTNLKIILKASALNIEPGLLSPNGTIEPEKLRLAAEEKRYDVLPEELQTAVKEIEDIILQDNVDPMHIDITLDKAYMSYVFNKLPKKHKLLHKYFTTMADTTNYAMAIRSMHLGKPYEFLKKMLLPGGNISESKWQKAYEEPENLPLLMQVYGGKLYQSAIAAFMDDTKIALFQKRADDNLLELFFPYKSSIDKDERLIGHLLMRDREAQAIRLILAGKENGFSNEIIQERLRELYV
jgi:V/A-type H+-transporting ATPase subunit C